MSNWKDRTDDEINIAVTCRVNNCYEWQFSEGGKLFFHCGADGGMYDSVDVVDYCNNPGDAWPIIVENEISLLRDTSTNDAWEAICKGWHTVSGFQSRVSLQGHCIDKNPLRAAMIVYLEMNGVKP